MRTRRSVLLGGAALAAGSLVGGAAGYRWWRRRPPPPRPQLELPVASLSELDHQRTFDVCIVGGGIAGAIVGIALARAGLQIVLLDCGLAPQQPMDARFGRLELFNNSGSIDYPLLATRIRTLGGTTSVWTGNCYRHVPPVFDDNPYAVEGAWPVSYAEMERWYEMAEETLRVRSRGTSSFAPPRRSTLPPLRGFSGNPELEGLLRRADVEAERAPRSWVARYREPVRALYDLLPELTHLHASRRDAPFRGRQVELRPFGSAQLAWPHEHEWGELQRVCGRRLTLIGVDRAQEFADPRRLGDSCTVLADNRAQGASQIDRHIARRTPRRDGVAKYPASDRARAMRGLTRAACFQRSQCRQDICGCDRRDRAAPQRREENRLEYPQQLSQRHSRQRRLIGTLSRGFAQRKPLACDQLKGMRLRGHLGLSLIARVDALRDEATRCVASLARQFQWNFGINAE